MLFRIVLLLIQGCFRVYLALFTVDLGLVQGLFRVYLGLDFFWCSFKVLQFLEVLVDRSKHCKLGRISLRHASKGDLGSVGKRTNAMRWQEHGGSPTWNSMDLGQTSAP